MSHETMFNLLNSLLSKSPVPFVCQLPSRESSLRRRQTKIPCDVPDTFIDFMLSQLILTVTAVAAKSLQSCPTLCDPTDPSPPGSPIPGIVQARTLEWVAISVSNA